MPTIKDVICKYSDVNNNYMFDFLHITENDIVIACGYGTIDKFECDEIIPYLDKEVKHYSYCVDYEMENEIVLNIEV